MARITGMCRSMTMYVCAYVHLQMRSAQWNTFKADTIGPWVFVRYSELSIAQGFRYARE